LRASLPCGAEVQSYLAAAFGLWVGIQAFINMGVNMGVLPTRIDAAAHELRRSSLIVSLAWVGLLLRVYHEAMLETRGSATVRHRGAGMGELQSSERPAMAGRAGNGRQGRRFSDETE